MKQRWSIPIVLALFALALAILFGQGAGQAQAPQASLVVSKSVDPGQIAPGRSVLYSVALENTSDAELQISSLVDTLPAGFEYVGLAPGSEWNQEPSDEVAPEIQWSGPVPVAAGDTLMLQYYVFVPGDIALSADPYTNTIVATVGTEQISDEAGLYVSIGDILVTKTASPDRVEPGKPVTYTVTFENSGYAARTLEVISDTMAPQLTFENMTTDSDVPADPADVGGTAVWTGAFPIQPQSQMVLKYVATTPQVDDALTIPNTAWGRLEDGTVLAPGEASVRVATGPTTIRLPFVTRYWAPAAFTVSKTANPTQAFAEEPAALIAYSVEFTNLGTDSGELGDIRDTLPAGFTFVRMLPGSDVLTNPSGTTGTIVWDGPFPVVGQTSLTLMYEVRATTTVGTYVNTVTANVTEGKPPEAPAKATVDIVEPILLSEEFENPSPYWQPFLNYWRLKEEQWYFTGPGYSDDGSRVLGHTWWFGVKDADRGAHDALYMFKDPAAEQWTDYSYQVRGFMGYSDAENRGQIGLWFRGKHQDDPDPGQWVTGYYFTIKPLPPRYAYLMQLRTDEECGDDCSHNYNYSNPLLLEKLTGSELSAMGISLNSGQWYTLRVEVDGPQIRCYLDGTLLFDYYDNVGTTFTEGTVGFVTYIAGDARFDHVLVEPLR